MIIPAYNAERYIGQALQSVLAQTYRRLEVIVVDDGSQDGTLEIVRSYSRKDARLRWLTQSNEGVAAARNRAIAESTGEYVAPLDADDLWCPSKLQRQLEAFLVSPNAVGLVYVWSQRVDETGQGIGACTGKHDEGSVFLPLVLGNFIGNSSAPLIRRECFDKAGGYDSTFRDADAQGCEDWDLYLRISERYRFVVVPECLVQYRQSAGSMSASPEKMEKSYRLLMESVRKRRPSITEYVFRWSASTYCLYLANICSRAGRPGRGLACLLKAAWLDGFVILNGYFHRLLYRNLALVLRPTARFSRQGSAPRSNSGARCRNSAVDVGPLWSRLRDTRRTRLLELQRRLGLDVETTVQRRRQQP